jgi:ankyrin repeat protein
MAIWCAHENTVELLISKGADVNITYGGTSPLEEARVRGREKIAQILKAAGAIENK